jgi:methionyl-tRNA formyltransferase
VRIVFLGTPEFATPSLAALAARFDVALVVAQPDRPQGRGRVVAAPPVKDQAFALGVPCMQVEWPNAPGAVAALGQVRADLFVVVAYGELLSPELLAVPRLGCVNLHASLLPEYRGASPIQAAILDGRAETGNTTMWMAEGLDSGDVILQRALPIGPDETAGERRPAYGQGNAGRHGAAHRRCRRAAHAAYESAATRRENRKQDGWLDFVQPAKARTIGRGR